VKLMPMLLLATCSVLQPLSAWAWSNHSLGSRLALLDVAALQQPVAYEAFDSFVQAQAPALEQLLDEQERFAVEHFADYPARPETLRFSAQAGSAGELRERFLQALRVNPEIRLAGFVQQLPGQAAEGRAPLKPEQVLLFRKLGPWSHWRYLVLKPGEAVTPLQVLSSAADEPDYGHDINLFSDNPGELGARYNFGVQPFGDARFEYSSQAPFHIGYYHEPELIYLAAPYLRQTLPHWRVYQYAGLARLAFAHGHDYWGYRFLGWAMHYVQDLTQPYHAKTVPGYSTQQLLWTALKGALGDSSERDALITRVADRHTAIERYQLERMQQLMAQPGEPAPLLAAYAQTAGAEDYPAFAFDYPQQVVAAESYLSADEFDRLIGQWLANQAPAEPGFSSSNQLHLATPDAALERVLVQLFQRFGQPSRNLLKATAPLSTAPLAAEP
jgi:hypothetical protein